MHTPLWYTEPVQSMQAFLSALSTGLGSTFALCHGFMTETQILKLSYKGALGFLQSASAQNTVQIQPRDPTPGILRKEHGMLCFQRLCRNSEQETP